MSHRRAPILLLVLLPLLGGVVCAGEPAPRAPVPPALTEGNTAFACDLYGRLRAGEGNLFLSPYSISACLGMVRAGAAGNTAGEMDRVLHYPTEGLGKAFHALDGALEAPMVRDGYGRHAKSVPAYQISIANRLFGQSGYAFHRAFLSQMKNDFGAALEQLDIARSPSGARARINGWVADETRNKIRDLMPPGTPTADTRLVLVNAIYFKSAWLEDFSKRATKDGDFHRQDGSTVKAKLMRQEEHFNYADVDGVQVLELMYRGGAMSMVVLLPRARDGLPALEGKLRPENVSTWLGALKSRKVDVTLPKFEFTSSFNLTQTLGAMGMVDAFSATRADFSGMTAQERMWIGMVVHKAFVAVDEEGTEAAAATAAAMLGAAIDPDKPVPFRADHPFLFLIRHRATGTILFLGRVTDPS